MPHVHKSQGYRGKRLKHSKDLVAWRLLQRKARRSRKKKKGAKGSSIRGLK